MNPWLIGGVAVVAGAWFLLKKPGHPAGDPHNSPSNNPATNSSLSWLPTPQTPTQLTAQQQYATALNNWYANPIGFPPFPPVGVSRALRRRSSCSSAALPRLGSFGSSSTSSRRPRPRAPLIRRRLEPRLRSQARPRLSLRARVLSRLPRACRASRPPNNPLPWARGTSGWPKMQEVATGVIDAFFARHPHLCHWGMGLLVPAVAHLYWRSHIHGAVIRLRKWDMLGLGKPRGILQEKDP